MRKTTFIAGFAAGYVLGARAGRARYEQIRALTHRIMESPTVQQATSQVQANAADALHTAKDKAGEALSDTLHGHRPGWLHGKRTEHAGTTSNGHTGWAAGSSGQMGV